MSNQNDESNGGCGGCITSLVLLVVGGLALWALVFGVTIGGRHYGISGCSAAHGVEFEAPP